jgi:Caspase domain
MNLKTFSWMLFLFCLATTVEAQTVYHFTYTFNKPGAAKEEAFFVRYDDGTGFARIKTNTTVTEIKLQEAFPGSNTGNPDYSKIYYEATGAKIISGTNTSTQSPVFWFLRNATGENAYDPWGVNEAAGGDSIGLTVFTTVKSIQLADLKKDKDFVLQFFKPEDVFYRNLFVVKSKGLNADEAKTRIHLMLVANTSDPIIGLSCKKDMERMIQTFKDLSGSIGIAPPLLTIISGEGISKAKVEKEIAALKPDPRDIVVFYYTGHGFRKERDNRRFPYIDLRSNPNEDYNIASMNMEDIFTKIKGLPNRMKLVLSDCCNTLVTATNAIGAPVPNKKGFGLFLSELNYRALFFDPKPRTILMTAASAGQKATSNNEFGGFFSYYFKVAVETACGQFKNNVSWESVFDEVRKNTIYKAEHTYCDKPHIPENICDQTPVMK